MADEMKKNDDIMDGQGDKLYISNGRNNLSHERRVSR